MNIVFVTYHTCARANKMAKALFMDGHNVVILQHLAASNTILYEQPLSSFYGNRVDLADKVDMLNDWADIYHIHNEPDWMVTEVFYNAEPHIPIIYDCHDLGSQRFNLADQDEIDAFKNSDAAIFPSIAYLMGAKKYHSLPDSYPIELVYSMCLKDDKPVNYPPPINALVYEGHHIAPIEGTDFHPGHPLYYDYRDYVDFIRSCSMRDIPTALYGTKPDNEMVYRQAGALINKMVSFPIMMQELTRYSWGFIGHPNDHPQWQKAMPNKMFEYLTAGIPIIAWNCEEAEMWIQGYDVGVVVHSYEDLAEVFWDQELQNHHQARVAELYDAGHLNMEIQVPKILKLYKRVLDKKGVAWDEGVRTEDTIQRSDS